MSGSGKSQDSGRRGQESRPGVPGNGWQIRVRACGPSDAVARFGQMGAIIRDYGAADLREKAGSNASGACPNKGREQLAPSTIGISVGRGGKYPGTHTTQRGYKKHAVKSCKLHARGQEHAGSSACVLDSPRLRRSGMSESARVGRDSARVGDCGASRHRSGRAQLPGAAGPGRLAPEPIRPSFEGRPPAEFRRPIQRTREF